MSKQAAERDETEAERRDRNLIDLMQELRVAFPGVQILLAFLLVVPFQSGWPDVTETQKVVYFTTLLFTVGSSICFIAPTTHHRIRFRDQDLEWIIQRSNRLMLIGLGLLASAMTGGLLLVSLVVLDTAIAFVVAGVVALVITSVWFGVPLARDRSEGG